MLERHCTKITTKAVRTMNLTAGINGMSMSIVEINKISVRIIKINRIIGKTTEGIGIQNFPI